MRPVAGVARPVAVLVSGRGSNLEALLRAGASEPDYPAGFRLVISNREGAGGLEVATRYGVPAQVISHSGRPREAFEAELDAALNRAGVEFVCLAGFMRLFTEGFVNRWHNRILNVHPSLLPAFRGRHAIADALEAGVAVAGCTVHLIRPEMDCGPILAQAATHVEAGDTVASLAARILRLEHRLYPVALRRLLSGETAGDARQGGACLVWRSVSRLPGLRAGDGPG